MDKKPITQPDLIKAQTLFWMLTFACLAAVNPAAATDVEFGFAAGMGQASDDAIYDYGRGVAVDALGNVYTTGSFDFTVDFDPGPGVFNLSGAGGRDIFVQKLDADGNFVWAKAMGLPSTDYGYGIAVDASGNVYTTGSFRGFMETTMVDFDPGPGVFNLNNAGISDVFVQKLDTDGNFVWARAMGGTKADVARAIAVDAAGNVYTTGAFDLTADFDPGEGTANLSGGGIFVSKLDSDGNFVWAGAMGGSNDDEGRGIAVDDSGNVYTTGIFEGIGDFDPGAGTFNLTAGGSLALLFDEIYVSKLDSDGNFVWAKSMGGPSDDQGRGIALDTADNVYTSGRFQDTADFDPGAGMAELDNTGNSGVFVSKLDSDGNYVWAREISATSGEDGWGITLDPAGNVYTTGSFWGTMDFDPGEGEASITHTGELDIFVSKLDSDGNYVWAKAMGGSSSEEGYAIAVDASENVYTTGYFEDTADFDPGEDTVNLTSNGGTDIFVSKLAVPIVIVLPAAQWRAIGLLTIMLLLAGIVGVWHIGPVIRRKS